MHFNAENDPSQDAELTQIVSAICKTFSKVASLSGDSSLNMSAVLFNFFLFNVRLDSIYSILTDSLSKL